MNRPKVQLFPEVNEAWLEKRRRYITATEAASLFALGSKSIAAVASEKLNPPERIKNEFMLIGNILEPAVLNAMQLRAGIKCEPAHPDKIVFIMDDENRLSATPDGKHMDEDGTFHLVECKTVGSSCPEKARDNFNKWKLGVPKGYAIQVHTQMAVAKVKHAFIACMGYHYPLPLVVYYIRQCPVIYDLICNESRRFWYCFDNDTVFEPCKLSRKTMLECLPQAESLHYLSHSWYEGD